MKLKVDFIINKGNHPKYFFIICFFYFFYHTKITVHKMLYISRKLKIVTIKFLLTIKRVKRFSFNMYMLKMIF